MSTILVDINSKTSITTYKDNEPLLDEAQKIVGGWVQHIDLESHGCLLVDEEGKLKRKKVNPDATEIYNKLFDGFIVGNVIHILPDARREW